MIHSYRKLALCFALLSSGLMLAGCNSKNKGWSLRDGKQVSQPRYVSTQKACNYQSKRNRALRLLNQADSVRQYNAARARRYERRAASLIAQARRCMSKRGVYRR